jgi:hypothetical protein
MEIVYWIVAGVAAVAAVSFFVLVIVFAIGGDEGF